MQASVFRSLRSSSLQGLAALGLALSGLTLCMAQPLPSAAPESVGMSTERLAKITATFNQEIADKKLPGAVVMVARKGKLVYSQAFGGLNNAAGAPMAKVRVTAVAAEKLASPACCAVTVQLPAPVSVIRLPLTVQLPVAVKTTASPDEAVALTVNGGSPYCLSPSDANVMACDAAAMVKVCATDTAGR